MPSFEKTCACCGTKGKYIATDIRPVFPEEKLLLAIILKKDTPCAFDNCSVRAVLGEERALELPICRCQMVQAQRA